MPHSGLLNLNKPAGMTSREAVNRVQRFVHPAKVGHAGTLDPLATGVLVVCVGAATRLIEYVQRMPKSYTGTFLLGRSSATEDIEGEVTELPGAPVPTHEEIVAAAERLVGRIEQRPPAFSALKVAGRRAYKLARRGEPVELKPREVVVHKIEVASYDYPELVLEVQCGSGTYIRSLGRDLAESVGTAAVMSALVRTAIGRFRLEDAVDPGRLTHAGIRELLQPPLTAVESLPRVTLSKAEVVEIGHGRTIPEGKGEMKGKGEKGEFAAIDANGRLVAILAPRRENRLGPVRNFPVE